MAFRYSGQSFLSQAAIVIALVGAVLSLDTLTTTNNVQVGGAVSLGGIVTATDTGTQNDYAPTGAGVTTSILRLNPASALTINGLWQPSVQQLLIICNVGTTASVVLANEAGASTAGHRIFGLANTNVNLPQATNSNTCAELLYDTTSSRWRVIATNTPTWNAAASFGAGVSNSTGSIVESASTGQIQITGNGAGAAMVYSGNLVHIRTTGTAPALTSCGTSPTITGTDIAGFFSTGTSGTTCTITFATTYTNEPSCIIRAQGTATEPTCTTSATAITCTTTIASTKYHYQCVGLI